MRLLLAISVKLGLHTTHLDVKTAFLNGELQENVLMCQPEGFVVKGNENKVCKLKKAIYGLKQSSRAWYQKVEEVLIGLDFKKSDYEPCLFMKRNRGMITIIALYVDDFIIFSNDENETDFLKDKLNSNFKIKDLGELKLCLGMKIRRENDMLILDQSTYIDHLLKKFNMTNCNSVNTPIENFDFNESNSSDKCQNPLYQKLIGSLMFLAVMTRPDIAYSVSFLSQFNNCHTEYHWKCAKRVLRYLKGTKNYCLVFKKTNEDLQGHVDADWGSDKTDRKSYTGFVFKLSGGAVSWKSCKQKTVALSSTEAEYMALSEATKEAIYLRNLLCEISGSLDCITIFNDNQGAQKLCSNPVFHDRSKHIDIRHHFVREALQNKTIDLKYVCSDEMLADVLTKGLKSVKHSKFVVGLGLQFFDKWGC